MAECVLNQEELDALSEVFNISFGAAANKMTAVFQAQAKIAKPKISQADSAAVAQLLQQECALIKFTFNESFAGNWWYCVSDQACAGLATKLSGGPVDFSRESGEGWNAVKGLFDEIGAVAYPTLSSTANRTLTVSGASLALNTGQRRPFEPEIEFPEGCLQTSFTFKVEGLFESVLTLFISCSCAKAIAEGFLQAIPEQMESFDASKRSVQKHDIPERLAQAIAYCKQMGDFSLIENLKAPVQVRIANRRMSLRDVWSIDAGSLLRFNKRKDETIDIVFGDRVIAKGEVVTLQEKFGAKITEVKL